MFDWLWGDGTNKSDEAKKQLTDLSGQKEIADILNKSLNAKFANMSPSDENYAQVGAGGEYYKEALDGIGTEEDALNKVISRNNNNYLGGILGSLINPITQTIGAGVDLATGNYEKSGRDPMSDLGALGESALTFIPGLGMVGKGAMMGAKGMALTGAGFNAADALRQGGSDTNFGDALGQAGTGALFGGGIGLAGSKLAPMMKSRGANHITDKYLSDPMNANASKSFIEQGMIPKLSQQVSKQPNFLGNYGGLYGNAMKSFVPKSTFGTVAAGGAGLYGGMQLLGGQQQPEYNPYDEEQMMMMNGGMM